MTARACSIRHRLAVVLAFAVAAAGCADASDTLDAYRGTAAPTVPSTESVDPGRPRAPTGGEVVEEPCRHEPDERCGSVLLPQSEGSPMRIAVHFRTRGTQRPGRPVLLLSGADPFVSLDDLALDRPLVELTARGAWPGTPRLSCPELGWLSGDPGHGDWGRVVAACAQRLDEAGVVIDAYDATHRANDISTALALLGFDEVDVVAPGQAAVDLAEASDPSWLRRVVEVQPAPRDALAAGVDGMMRTLETVWMLCATDDGCRTAGTVSDFLDVIAGFATDPIVIPATGDPEQDERVLDDLDWIDRVMADARDPDAALFLPELHRALRDRDRDRLATYVEASDGSVAADGFTSYCDAWASTSADAATLHPVLARWATDTMAFVDEFCRAWGRDAVPAPPARRDGRVLAVVAAGGLGPAPNQLASTRQVLVTPTAGRPPADCIAAAASAWFDDGTVTDADACRTRPEITARDAPFELVEGFYEYELEGSPLVLRTVVPDTWRNEGVGLWERHADPLDLTSLDLYVLPDSTPPGAVDWFVDGWQLDDPTTARRVVGERAWQVVTAVDPWSPGEQRYRAAFASVDDVVIGFVLAGAASELDALTADVFDPALAAARIDR